MFGSTGILYSTNISDVSSAIESLFCSVIYHNCVEYNTSVPTFLT